MISILKTAIVSIFYFYVFNGKKNQVYFIYEENLTLFSKNLKINIRDSIGSFHVVGDSCFYAALTMLQYAQIIQSH